MHDIISGIFRWPWQIYNSYNQGQKNTDSYNPKQQYPTRCTINIKQELRQSYSHLEPLHPEMVLKTSLNRWTATLSKHYTKCIIINKVVPWESTLPVYHQDDHIFQNSHAKLDLSTLDKPLRWTPRNTCLHLNNIKTN